MPEIKMFIGDAGGDVGKTYYIILVHSQCFCLRMFRKPKKFGHFLSNIFWDRKESMLFCFITNNYSMFHNNNHEQMVNIHLLMQYIIHITTAQLTRTVLQFCW